MDLAAFRLGVGAATGPAVLKVGQPWAGGHQKVVDSGPGRADLEFEFTSRQAIHVVALDEHIAKTGLPHPAYMKVDIDGSELPLLQGARETLEHSDLRAVLFELCRTDPSYEAATGFLGERGFAVVAEHEVEAQLVNVLFARG